MEKDKYSSFSLAVAAVVLSLTWLLIHLWKKNHKLPPGPWGLPILGYYPFLSSKPCRRFGELAKKYGDVFSFRTAGGHLLVVINGVKAIKEVFINRADEVIGRPKGNNLVDWATDGTGITQEEGAPWREQRRFFLHTAKTSGFGKMEMEGLIHENIRQFIRDLQECRTLSEQEIKFLITLAVGNVSTELLLSAKFKKDDPTFRNIVDGLSIMLKIFIGNLNYLVGIWFDLGLWLLPGMRNVRHGKNVIQKAAYDIIEKHAKTFDPDNPKDLVDQFLKKMNDQKLDGKSKESTFDKERLVAAIMNILIDGLESISSAAACMLMELRNHPDVQLAVQKELDNVVGRERLPSWTDRQNLPYYDAVLQELWRFVSPFEASTLYSNFEEMTLHGYRIPQRSLIVANLWSIHNDPEAFPNPEKFDPGRFLNVEGKRIKRDGPYPFGIGKRACVGESLAQMVVFLFIASILQNFKVVPTANNESYTFVQRQ